MIFRNEKRTLDNIDATSFGELIFENGQFYLEGVREDLVYELSRVLVCLLRDLIAAYAQFTEEPNAIGYNLVDAAPEEYKLIEDRPYGAALLAWKNYLYEFCNKINGLAEL